MSSSETRGASPPPSLAPIAAQSPKAASYQQQQNLESSFASNNSPSSTSHSASAKTFGSSVGNRQQPKRQGGSRRTTSPQRSNSTTTAGAVGYQSATITDGGDDESGNESRSSSSTAAAALRGKEMHSAEDALSLVEKQQQQKKKRKRKGSSGDLDDGAESTSSESSSSSNFFRSLFESVYGLWKRFCCVEDGDTFDVMIRKMGVAVLFLCAPVPLSFGIYYTYLSYFASTRFDQNMLGTKIHAILLYPFSFCVALPYIQLRINRAVTTLQVDFASFIILLFLSMNILVLPQYGNVKVIIACSLFAILARAKYVVAHCVLSISMCFLQTYNEAFLDDPNATLVLLPGWRHGPHMEAFVGHATALVCFIFLLTGISLQSAEHTRQVASAAAAIDVSKHIVNLLRRYDTQAVTEALDAEEAQDVDPKLVALLSAMNKNLESYKPFLPNYVFHNEDDEASVVASQIDDDDEGDLEFDEGSLSASDAAATPTGAGGLRRMSEVSSHSDSSQTSKTSMTNESSAVAVGAAGAVTSHSLKQAASASAAAINNGSVFEGKISFALVCAPKLHGSSGTAEGAFFVDTILQLAQETRASVHSMIGDSAQFTWNATHRVLQPEMKSAKFFAKLAKLADELFHEKQFLGGGGSIRSKSRRRNVVSQQLPAGALFSGKASCYSLTSTTTKQHATLISSNWMGALNTAFTLAQTHRALLIDEATDLVSQNHYESVVVDEVWYDGMSSKNVDAALLGDMIIADHRDNGVNSRHNNNTRGATSQQPFGCSGGAFQPPSSSDASPFLPSSGTASPLLSPTSPTSNISNKRKSFNGLSRATSSACLFFSPTLKTSRRLLLEVLHECHHDDEGEWMYQLETKNSKAAETLQITECAKALFSVIGEAMTSSSSPPDLSSEKNSSSVVANTSAVDIGHLNYTATGGGSFLVGSNNSSTANFGAVVGTSEQQQQQQLRQISRHDSVYYYDDEATAAAAQNRGNEATTTTGDGGDVYKPREYGAALSQAILKIFDNQQQAVEDDDDVDHATTTEGGSNSEQHLMAVDSLSASPMVGKQLISASASPPPPLSIETSFTHTNNNSTGVSVAPPKSLQTLKQKTSSPSHVMTPKMAIGSSSNNIVAANANSGVVIPSVEPRPLSARSIVVRLDGIAKLVSNE